MMIKNKFTIFNLLWFLIISAQTTVNNSTSTTTNTTESTSQATTVRSTTTVIPVKPECIATTENSMNSNSFWKCTVIKTNGSVIEISTMHWSPNELKTFAENVIHLENIEMKLFRRDFKGISFPNLKTFENFSLAIHNSTSLNFDIFPMLKKCVNVHLKIRGNRGFPNYDYNQFRLSNICQKSKSSWDIQNQDECMFLDPILSENEYADCKLVYGEMKFDGSFPGYLARKMNFKLNGCFKVIGANLRILAQFAEVDSVCDTKHEFIRNNLLCKEDRIMTTFSFDPNKIQMEIGDIEVQCAKAECFGYLVLERETRYFLGCEKVVGTLQIDESSGDLSRRMRDFSFVRTIEGQLTVSNNTSIQKLIFPFLKSVKAKRCPAVIIENMPNLTSLVFDPYFSVSCGDSSAKYAIIIKNCPKLILPNDVWGWDKQGRMFIDGSADFAPHGPFYYLQFLFYISIGAFILIEAFLFIFKRGNERSEELEDLIEFTKE